MKGFLWDIRLYRGEDSFEDAIISYRTCKKEGVDRNGAELSVYSVHPWTRGTKINDLAFVAGATQALRLITGTSWRVECDKTFSCIIIYEENSKTRKYRVGNDLLFLEDIDVDPYGSLILYFTNDISNSSEPLMVHLNHNLKMIFKNKTPEKLPRAWIIRGAVWAVNWYLSDVLDAHEKFRLPASSNWNGFP